MPLQLTPSSCLMLLEVPEKKPAVRGPCTHVQAAFKRNPLGSDSKAEAGFPEGALPSQVEDWDAVKAEDKRLVHQMDSNSSLVAI